MASLSKPSSPIKPKLGRSNAIKNAEFIPSDSSPSSPGTPDSTRFRALNRDSSRSFRVDGQDSQEEIKQLLNILGLSEGPDAFGISPEAWEAGKLRSRSFERFTAGPHAQSRGVEGQQQVGFSGRTSGAERASSLSPQLRPISPVGQSSSSSSDDSFSSDASSSVSHGPFFAHIEPSQNQVLFSHVEPPQAQSRGLFMSRCEEGKPMYGIERISGEEERHLAVTESIAEPASKLWRAKSDNPYHPTSNPVGLSPLAREAVRESVLRPPPGHSPADRNPLSTHDLLSSLAPDEPSGVDNCASPASAHHSTSDEEVESDIASEEEDTHISESDTEAQVWKDTGAVAQHPVPIQVGNTSPARQRLGETASDRPEQTTSVRSIGSWRKLDLLGSGSFGTVYEGLSEDGIYFAVKEVSLVEHGMRAQQCVSQLEQEIEVLSKYQHENIVRYLGTEKERDKLYIFLELVAKGSLASLYQKHPLFDIQIRSYTRQILNGLKYLHDQKIVHRDIKCANILVDVNGRVKLADFGLARQISQLDELKSCKGSAYWMAPEVVDPRKTYSHPADIWSLGCTVLEMATRGVPFGNMEWHSALYKVAHGEGPPIPETLSADAKDFIGKCLEVNPKKRPTAAQLLEHAFAQNIGGSGLTPRNSFSQEICAGELEAIAEESSLERRTSTSS